MEARRIYYPPISLISHLVLSPPHKTCRSRRRRRWPSNSTDRYYCNSSWYSAWRSISSSIAVRSHNTSSSSSSQRAASGCGFSFLVTVGQKTECEKRYIPSIITWRIYLSSLHTRKIPTTPCHPRTIRNFQTVSIDRYIGKARTPQLHVLPKVC